MTSPDDQAQKPSSKLCPRCGELKCRCWDINEQKPCAHQRADYRTCPHCLGIGSASPKPDATDAAVKDNKRSEDVMDKPDAQPREFTIRLVPNVIQGGTYYQVSPFGEAKLKDGERVYVIEKSAYLELSASCESWRRNHATLLEASNLRIKKLEGLHKDHQDDWKRIQDCERKNERLVSALEFYANQRGGMWPREVAIEALAQAGGRE